jgi:translation initiation factor 1
VNGVELLDKTHEKEKMSSGIVLSTAHGRKCPTCDKPIAECSCRQKNTVPEGDGLMGVERQTKGQKGKSVTVITGVPLDATELTELGKQHKAICGAGGTLKDAVIEVQGDHREVLLEELKRRGWTVKRAGG